jgi:hypothetical protein|tara:strand:+ start:408 stop:512 length:105 start_codon:yes stop_codon:yes gene_type:complete
MVVVTYFYKTLNCGIFDVKKTAQLKPISAPQFVV